LKPSSLMQNQTPAAQVKKMGVMMKERLLPI
jgi:hypothetical protein